MLSALAGAARSPALHSGPLQRVGDETCGANASAVPMHRAYAPAAYTSARIAQRKATKRGPQSSCLRDWFKRVRGRIFYQNRLLDVLCLSFGGRKLFSAQSPARANPENRAVYRCNLILSRARGIILVDITAGLGDTVRKQNRKQTDIVRNVFCRRISVLPGNRQVQNSDTGRLVPPRKWRDIRIKVELRVLTTLGNYDVTEGCARSCMLPGHMPCAWVAPRRLHRTLPCRHSARGRSAGWESARRLPARSA